MAHDIVRHCRFSTPRLWAGEWHSLADSCGLDLPEAVGMIMSRSTTAELPPEWRGDFDRERAIRWIVERDEESPTLLLVERSTNKAAGLLMLFEAGVAGALDVRLGYVLASTAWGRGLATEAVEGVVDWARSEPMLASISGGVTDDNGASARVLEKNGFERSEGPDGTLHFRRWLRPAGQP